MSLGPNDGGRAGDMSLRDLVAKEIFARRMTQTRPRNAWNWLRWLVGASYYTAGNHPELGAKLAYDSAEAFVAEKARRDG